MNDLFKLKEEIMKEIIDALILLTGEEFAEIVNGKIYKYPTNERIPKKYIAFQNIKPDGFYRLTPSNCGQPDKCKIGKPRQECVERLIYSKNKCAIYHLDNVENLSIHTSVQKLRQLLRGLSDGNK
jgi:hypothetical protein